MAYNFDFSYLKNGAPAVTLSSFGIAFNKGAIESLGTPDQVIIGYDPDQQAIGVRARGEDTTSPCYDFAPRVPIESPDNSLPLQRPVPKLFFPV